MASSINSLLIHSEYGYINRMLTLMIQTEKEHKTMSQSDANQISKHSATDCVTFAIQVIEKMQSELKSSGLNQKIVSHLHNGIHGACLVKDEGTSNEDTFYVVDSSARKAFSIKEGGEFELKEGKKIIWSFSRGVLSSKTNQWV